MSTVLTGADWLALFAHFLSLSLLAIGGAITTAPAMHHYLVSEKAWLSDGQFTSSVALAQAAVFLACAAKSNAVYKAYNAARQFVKQDVSRPVPIHLRNAPTKLMKELGYGKAYRYAHDEPEAYAAGEHYLPDGNWRTFHLAQLGSAA